MGRFTREKGFTHGWCVASAIVFVRTDLPPHPIPSHTHLRLEVCSERRWKRKERGRAEGGSIDYRLEPEKEHGLMDSNTAYHFSRLLETTPYLGHCWRVVKMERYRVCAARRKKREKNFRETRIVTRHRATARPYYVPRASNFTRASLRDVSLPFPFFFHHSPPRKSISTTRKLLFPAEEIDRRKLYPLLSVSLDEPVIRRIDRGSWNT